MTPHPRALKPAVLAGAALASLLALTACSGGASADQGGGAGGLKVVATTTQLTDFASEVGGDDIELTGLLSPNASAHHFDPSPADLLALGEADVLIVNGADLETFVDDAVDASGFDGTIITAADGIDLGEAKHITAEGGETESHDHADEAEHDHEHAEDEHAEDAHAEHDHDHGDLNPHIWTSPKNAIGMVAEIADGLGAADAEHVDGYEQRAGDYTERLQQLDAWVAAQFERVPAEERVLVSGHDSLRYYLHDYGIEFVGSILPSFEDNAEPSAADIDALVAAIRERGVKAVFVESSMSPKLAQTIADEAGVEVVDSENLYADSLGAPDSDGATYIGATVHNTALILDAWGAQVDAVPDSLQG